MASLPSTTWYWENTGPLVGTFLNGVALMASLPSTIRYREASDDIPVFWSAPSLMASLPSTTWYREGSDDIPVSWSTWSCLPPLRPASHLSRSFLEHFSTLATPLSRSFLGHFPTLATPLSQLACQSHQDGAYDHRHCRLHSLA